MANLFPSAPPQPRSPCTYILGDHQQNTQSRPMEGMYPSNQPYGLAQSGSHVSAQAKTKADFLESRQLMAQKTMAQRLMQAGFLEEGFAVIALDKSDPQLGLIQAIVSGAIAAMKTDSPSEAKMYITQAEATSIINNMSQDQGTDPGMGPKLGRLLRKARQHADELIELKKLRDEDNFEVVMMPKNSRKTKEQNAAALNAVSNVRNPVMQYDPYRFPARPEHEMNPPRHATAPTYRDAKPPLTPSPVLALRQLQTASLEAGCIRLRKQLVDQEKRAQDRELMFMRQLAKLQAERDCKSTAVCDLLLNQNIIVDNANVTQLRCALSKLESNEEQVDSITTRLEEQHTKNKEDFKAALLLTTFETRNNLRKEVGARLYTMLGKRAYDHVYPKPNFTELAIRHAQEKRNSQTSHDHGIRRTNRSIPVDYLNDYCDFDQFAPVANSKSQRYRVASWNTDHNRHPAGSGNQYIRAFTRLSRSSESIGKLVELDSETRRPTKDAEKESDSNEDLDSESDEEE